MSALEQALLLEIGDVLVDGGQGTETESSGDLFIGRGVSVLLGEAGEEVDDLFLSPGDCHAGIVANKKRIEKLFSKFFCGEGSWMDNCRHRIPILELERSNLQSSAIRYLMVVT